MLRTRRTRFTEHEKRTLTLSSSQNRPKLRKRVLEFLIDQAVDQLGDLDNKRDKLVSSLQDWNRELDAMHAKEVGGVG